MTSPDGRDQYSNYLPVEVINLIRERAEEEGKPQWKVLTEMVEMATGASSIGTEAGYNREITRLRQEAEEDREEGEMKLRQWRKKMERADRLEEQRDAYLDNREAYSHILDDILSDLEANPNRTVFGFRGKLLDAAEVEYSSRNDKAMQNVIEDLRELADEYDVGVMQFQKNPNQTGGALADGGGEDDEDHLGFMKNVGADGGEDDE